ncbi:EF-hand domain-containing protein [Amycolatopsis silviterrae]|uniref:EF-hand domain-containing protein n=1 Tax=Amycolatopsis silviterrae TaxID=1656914 RepID=A0ABW5HHX4_9PSEU
MSVSDFLTTKIGRGFDGLDADGDGRLTENDHVAMGQRAALSLGYEPGTAAERKIIDAYLNIWREVHLPHIPAGESAISRERFVESSRTLADDPAAARATVGALAETFLSIADTDGDGRVSPAEYLVFLRSHFPDIAEAEANEAFAHLDRDGDGSLTAGEFVEAIIEFWSSSDPDAPGNWWMGRPS